VAYGDGHPSDGSRFGNSIAILGKSSQVGFELSECGIIGSEATSYSIRCMACRHQHELDIEYRPGRYLRSIQNYYCEDTLEQSVRTFGMKGGIRVT
jgi:hypothetical protein